MFKNITGNGLDIQNIRLSESCPSDCTTYLMWWEGHWVEAWWVDKDFDASNGQCWGDPDNWLPVDKTFDVGEAFFVQAIGTSVNPVITAAGQVLDANNERYYGIELPKGSLKFVTNPFPGGLDIQNIKLSDGCPSDCTTYMMWWEGHWVEAWWVDKDFDSSNGQCWGDPDNWLPVTKDLFGGEGFFVQAIGTAVEPEILFPNPLYKAPSAD